MSNPDIRKPHVTYDEYVQSIAKAYNRTPEEAKQLICVKLFKESMNDSIKPSENIVSQQLVGINC